MTGRFKLHTYKNGYGTVIQDTKTKNEYDEIEQLLPLLNHYDRENMILELKNKMLEQIKPVKEIPKTIDIEFLLKNTDTGRFNYHQYDNGYETIQDVDTDNEYSITEISSVMNTLYDENQLLKLILIKERME